MEKKRWTVEQREAQSKKLIETWHKSHDNKQFKFPTNWEVTSKLLFCRCHFCGITKPEIFTLKYPKPPKGNRNICATCLTSKREQN